MSYQAAKILDARVNVIRVAHPDAPDFPRTALVSTVSAAGTTLTVADNSGFSQDDWAIIGDVGGDSTEAKRITAAVTLGQSLTTQALTFAHPIGSPVKRSLWDSVEISGSATIGGSKTVIGTVPLQLGSDATEYVITGAVFSYYFARYKNTFTSAFSSYSDAAPALGYAPDTVRAVKVTALSNMGESISDIITDDFLNTEIANCEVDIWKEKRRWAQFEREGVVLGTLVAGDTLFPMPADISDPDTGEAIRALRIRHVGMLRPLDLEAIEAFLWDTTTTTLAAAANPGDTFIALNSVADFQDIGSVSIGSDSVTYTGRDTTLKRLTGVPATGNGAVSLPWAIGKNVWQGGMVESGPSVFTVTPGFISLVLPPARTYWDQGIYISYYAKPTYPTSDATRLNWPDPELYHLFLSWKIALRRSNGTATTDATQFKSLYEARKATLLSRARLQDTPRFMPRRRWNRQNFSLGDDDIVPWSIT